MTFLRNLMILATLMAVTSCGDDETPIVDDPGCPVDDHTLGTMVLGAVGCPTWTFADAHVFSADLGAGASNAFDIMMSLVTPPDDGLHAPNAQLGVGPGVAHAGPYDTEFSAGLARGGFTAGTTFPEASFQDPNGILVVMMGVPAANAPQGKSPDFASGPIIPKAAYPIAFTGALFKDGEMFDPNWGGPIPSVDVAMNDPSLDGVSHMPMFFADNVELAGHAGDDPSGSYELILTYTDATNQGWVVQVPFTIQ